MSVSVSHPRLLLRVLFESYRRSTVGEQSSARFTACCRANDIWLRPEVLQSVTTRQLADHLAAFAEQIDAPAWHAERIGHQAGFVRHGLNHLLNGSDPLGVRFARCASADGSYAMAGAGRSFWAAVLKATNPDRYPDWTPQVERGLERVGAFDTTSDRLTTAVGVYRELLTAGITADYLDLFFTRVAGMRGRELTTAPARTSADRIRELVRSVRVQAPLRRRLTTHGDTFNTARRLLATALDRNDAALVSDALTAIGGPRLALALLKVQELFAAGPESDAFDEFATLGLVIPSALLHLHDPKVYPLWRNDLTHGLAALDDSFHANLPPRTQYALYRDVVDGLRDRFRVHPLEAADVIASAVRPEPTAPPRSPHTFHGFAADTFTFLRELAANNQKAWMDAERDRYQFFVREPMVELCTGLAERYVRPVLAHEHGWDLETDPQPGKALTSIAKNDYGRSGPYLPELWVTFYRRQSGSKRHDVQLFVKADADGIRFGFHLGRTARDAGKRFRKAVQEHGEAVYLAAVACGATDAFTFRTDTSTVPIRSATALREWATGKTLFAERHIPADHPLLRTDDLVGEILIAFDRLVPLLAAVIEDDPLPILTRRSGDSPTAPPFDRSAFHTATFLSEPWLNRTLDLLTLKKQLILHGVPGTGKTHVARSLARLLTNDRNGAVRLVQFHPAYSYEEFVEGIRPRSVEANGRTEVSYPVEDGVLCAFAAEAAAHPSVPHVLVVDEINRGNLPRIFGELLFLLEYRDQAVTLPHSQRAFRMPANLYLIGTMNSADRSTVALDQALRRRFSFVEMPADAAVLAGWLEQNQTADTFGPRVVHLFEELNRKLARDLGPDKQIGHSFFMVPALTEQQLRAVWDHHVHPLLGDYFAARSIPPGYDLESLLDREPRRKRVSV